MFMRRLMICFCLFLCYAAQAENVGPKLGRPAPEDLIKSWNIDVFPDGEGLPEGSGNAVKGKQVYETYCRSCHGVEGSGGSADELAGARHSLTDNPPDKTIGTYWPYATTIFDFTRRAMPLNALGSLSHDQLYAVTAYLLYLNGIIKETDIMNAKTLSEVKMPNREGFIRIDTE
jgi:mono/diheme cytochrome c family protein